MQDTEWGHAAAAPSFLLHQYFGQRFGTLRPGCPQPPPPPELPGALTSVVLHPGVVGDALRPKAEAQDVAGIRAVSDQEGPIRLPFQLHLRVLPVHGPPVPPALRKRDTERQQTGQGELHHQPKTALFAIVSSLLIPKFKFLVPFSRKMDG